MANCSMCGKKFGFLEEKYKHKDKDGNFLIYCEKCNEEFEKEEKKRIKKEKEKELKKILKINKKWEYKILNLNTVGSGFNATGNKINPDLYKKLNDFGLEGWELVSAVSMNSLAARLGASSTATEWVSCIFKRRLL